MPFIGKQPQTGAYSKLDAITASATDTYNLTLDGSAYFPQSANHLLVSLNGVMQAPQDSFTVSGSQITFASALTASDSIDFIIALGDTLDIGTPSDGTVSTAKLVDSAVTSAKLDTNIDIAGTLDVTGATTLDDGLVVDNDGATVATFDRATSDGTIVDLQKDGSTVGSIGVFNIDNLFISGNSTHAGLGFSDAHVEGFKNGSTQNGTIDLGSSGARFKDLYLSGGVYLGGTGADNYLDDYEEGTWTPTADQGLTGFETISAKYTKIGSLVFIQCYLRTLTGKSASQIRISGLPFNSQSDGYSTGSVETETGKIGVVRTQSNDDQLIFYRPNTSTLNRENLSGNDAGGHIIFGIAYRTNS